MLPVGEPVMTRLRVLGAVSLPASSCASGGTEAALAGAAAGDQLQEQTRRRGGGAHGHQQEMGGVRVEVLLVGLLCLAIGGSHQSDAHREKRPVLVHGQLVFCTARKK